MLSKVSSSCFLQDIHRVTDIVKFGKSIVGDRGDDKIYVERKRRSIVIWDMDIS
jgi:hypothetical protein